MFYHYWNPEEVKKPDLEEVVVLCFPESDTKTVLLNAWKKYHQDLEEVEEHNRIVELAELANETNDPYLAWYVLEERKEHEYEGFMIERLEAPMGIQNVIQRLKMKPAFSVSEAESMIARKLKAENISAIYASQRRFRNITNDAFVLGGVLFGTKDKLTSECSVPMEAVSEAESDKRLEKVHVDLDKVRLWDLNSIHRLDAEDMVFSYWYKTKGEKIRPTVVHVYKNGGLKCLNITRLIRSIDFAEGEWTTMELNERT